MGVAMQRVDIDGGQSRRAPETVQRFWGDAH